MSEADASLVFCSAMAIWIIVSAGIALPVLIEMVARAIAFYRRGE